MELSFCSGADRWCFFSKSFSGSCGCTCSQRSPVGPAVVNVDMPPSYCSQNTYRCIVLRAFFPGWSACAASGGCLGTSRADATELRVYQRATARWISSGAYRTVPIPSSCMLVRCLSAFHPSDQRPQSHALSRLVDWRRQSEFGKRNVRNLQQWYVQADLTLVHT